MNGNMTNGIHVDPAEMETHGKSTLNLAEELKSQIDDLTKNESELQTIWKGDAANTFDEAVESQLKNLNEFKLLIEEMGNKIVGGASTFNTNEENNVTEAKKMFKNMDV